MKIFYNFIIFSVLVSSGCGEDGAFSVGGVSLGGTGTGAGIPPIGGSNTNPPTPGNSEDPEPIFVSIDHFEFLYHAPEYQNCNGIERTFQFIDKSSGKVLLDGSKRVLSSMDAKDMTNVLLRVIVKNTTSQTVYEYIDACRVPVRITKNLNDESIELENSSKFSCNDNDSYLQIYQANQQKNYDFDFNLPNQLAIWKLNYQSKYSFGRFADKSSRLGCDPLEISLSTVAVEDKFSRTELNLDDGIRITEPLPPNLKPPVLTVPLPIPPVTQLPVIIDSPQISPVLN